MSAVHPPLLPLLSEGRARADDAKKEPPDEEPEKEEEGEPLSDCQFGRIPLFVPEAEQLASLSG
jgi:hypothetical protein